MRYYIGYYNCDKTRNENRIVSPAAESKMNYIISALSDATDEEFEVVSPAETRESKLVRGRKFNLGDKAVLKTFTSFSSKNKLIRVLGHFVTKLYVFLYLIKNVHSDDHLIVYHSLLLMSLIKFVKKLKKCRLTIEVEELYSDVTEDEQLREKEISYLQIADSYVFITELLKNQVNTEKPSIISHGTYKPVQESGYRFGDDKIHVVYAGTFSQTKGGVQVAISAAEYLDDNYVLEILGRGSQADTLEVEKKIEEVSDKTKCRVNYVGLKTGDDFESYIQACHIGLSTQQADAKFGATSFPSKILMYMSNGLRVVSVRIPAVENSLVGEHIYYYDTQDAEEIAQVIKSVKFDDEYDSRKILEELHKNFVVQLKSLLHR